MNYFLKKICMYLRRKMKAVIHKNLVCYIQSFINYQCSLRNGILCTERQI